MSGDKLEAIEIGLNMIEQEGAEMGFWEIAIKLFTNHKNSVLRSCLKMAD